MEDIFSISSGKALIDITLKEGDNPSIQEILRHHRERTGIGADKLLRLKQDIPEGLTPARVSDLLYGKIKNARADQIQYLFLEWQKLPTLEVITANDEIRNELRFLYRETEVSTQRLLSKKDDVPEGLSAAKIDNVIEGKTKTIRVDHLKYVLHEWQKLPRHTIVDIADEARIELQALNQKTNIGPGRLLKGRRSEMPGLTTKIIQGVLSGKIKTIRQDYLEYMLNLWRFLNEANSKTIPVTQEILDKLRDEIYRTKISPHKLIKKSKNIPHNLSGTVIARWLNSDLKEAREYHIKYVLERLSEYPDTTQKKRRHFGPLTRSKYIKLSNETITEIKFHYNRTGVGPVRLLNRRKDIPQGLNPGLISNWLNTASKSAHEDYLEYVLSIWKSLPDKQTAVRLSRGYTKHEKKAFYNSHTTEQQVSILKVGLQPISENDLAALRLHRERTGIGGAVLLRRASNKPEGLNEFMISSWINGRARTAQPEHIAYVLSLYAETLTRKEVLPKQPRPKNLPPKTQNKPRIQNYKSIISIEDLLLLRHHRERTGMDGSLLLRGANDKPKGLNANIVLSWLDGSTRYAVMEQLTYVLARYASMPPKKMDELISDKKQSVKSKLDPVPISSEELSLLRFQYERTGLSGPKLLSGVKDKPLGLSGSMIFEWLNGKRLTAQPGHIVYILGLYEVKPNRPEKVRKQSEPKTKLSLEDLKILRSHRERTGISGSALLRDVNGKPKGLTANIISGWISGKDLIARTDHIAYVLALYKSKPDKKIKILKAKTLDDRPSKNHKPHISEEDLAALRAHRERTGLNGTMLLRGATGKPQGLIVDMITGWINGKRRVARPEHISYVLSVYESMPSQTGNI